MLNRRDFLRGAVAATALAAMPGYAEEKREQLDINAKLKQIAEELRRSPVIADVEMNLADNPTIGLTQWRWFHFNDDLSDEQYPVADRVNNELLQAMTAVHNMRDAGLESLMHEGVIKGQEDDQMRMGRSTHRQLIRNQFTVANPFTISRGDIPSEKKVDEELLVMKNLQRPMWQTVYPENYGARSVKVSPLGRLGAGYFLNATKSVKFLAAEDPFIDKKAAWALQHGTKEEKERWVMTERDKHFVKVMRERREKMVHFLVGCAHDLKDDISINNAEHPEKISQIIVTTKGISDYDAPSVSSTSQSEDHNPPRARSTPTD